MADGELAHKTITTVNQAAPQAVRGEFGDVNPRASGIAQQILGSGAVHEWPDFQITVEVAEWPEAIHVHSPTRPGAVKGTVEKVLRELGLTRL